jgi:hypothetical protein
MGVSPRAAVGPLPLSGIGLEGPRQMVLGPETMASLHAHLGETVTVSNGGGGSERLRIVGTATMPAIMGLQMGTGALVDYHVIPAPERNTQGNPVTGPNAYLVRTRGGSSPAAFASLATEVTHKINTASSAVAGSAGGAVGVLRPTEIVSSGSIETLPTVLGVGLGAGAVAALAITLVASVRRRRRALAILKTLGMSGRQLATIVAWQASVASILGVVVGVPLGIVAGRLLWDQFGSGIGAALDPTVPAVVVVAIALGAVVLANLVAAVPGRIAARTPTVVLFRVD